MSPIRESARRRQRGAALVIVLILLLVMTWMGVSSMRGTMLGERMSASIYDRSIAFQATEATLREAEGLLQSKPAFPVAGCVNGLCAFRLDMAGTDLPRWQDPATPWRESAVALGVDSDGDGTNIATNPEFVIEAMGTASNWTDCGSVFPIESTCKTPRFRITARSAEANRARVMLQSSFSLL